MRFVDYLKEKGLSFLFLLLAFLFALLVFRLDSRFHISESNASYIVMGWSLLLFTFLIIDFLIARFRSTKFQNYCKMKAIGEPSDEFGFPADRQKAELVKELGLEFERYKAQIISESAEEMEFITKWLHDVKVPIAASRLILESQEDQLPVDFYKNMDKELFTIEESVMRVFYEMKSNRFSDDYKVTDTSTKKLISRALKPYSSFFRYKDLSLIIDGEDYDVITDEKWSSYILSQVISNAVKYSAEGKRIELSTSRSGQNVTISVKNYGKGIAEEDLKRIFSKGYTSTEGRNGEKATGYGLYLSKKLCNLLGHSLTVESKYREYVVFHLSFTDGDTIYNVTKL